MAEYPDYRLPLYQDDSASTLYTKNTTKTSQTTNKEETVTEVKNKKAATTQELYQDNGFLNETFVNPFYKKSVYGNTTYHKSLDFSNRGFKYTNNGYGVSGNLDATIENSDDYYLRAFHQMRIFIEIPNGMQAIINQHGKNLGGSNTTFLISSNLPETVSYQVRSNWSAPLSGFNIPLVNALAMLADNLFPESFKNYVPDSLVNRVQTIQVWNGVEPLGMQLTIPVLDDSHSGDGDISTNLAEALEILGSLALPTYNENEKFGFYTPPPTPYELTFKWKNQKVAATGDKNNSATKKLFTKNHAKVMIQLGGMLLIDNCIIKGIRVTYKDTKSQLLHKYARWGEKNAGFKYLLPQLAEVTLDISTVEAMTSQVYSRMLWCRRQSNMGKGNFDLNPLREAADAKNKNSNQQQSTSENSGSINTENAAQPEGGK